jgi:hypothetical protein
MKFRRAVTGEPYAGSFILNPFEIAIGALSLLLGVAFLLKGLHIGQAKSAINILPNWLILAWAGLNLAGGLAMIVGVTWRGDQAFGRGIEKAGLWLIISAWSTYALTIAYISLQLYLGILFGLTIALSCLGRIIALNRLSKAMLHVQSLRENGDG